MTDRSVSRLARWWFGGVLLAIAGAHSVTWWVAGSRLLDGIGAFEADAVRDGWHVEHGTARRSGWPWAASVLLPGVVARRDPGGISVELRAPVMAVSVSAADPDGLVISGFGTVAVGSDVPPGQATAWLRIPLSNAAPSAFELRDVVAGGLRAGLVNGQVTASAFELTAAPVVLDQAMAPPFDRGFAVTLGATLSRPLHAEGSPRDTAADWQAGGGTVTIPRIELNWGPLHVTGSGTGGLDANLQHRGRATLHIEGGPSVLDAAAQARVVTPGAAAAMRAVFGLLALGSSSSAVAIPVTLEDETLTAAQFPLLRLARIGWPAPALVAPRNGP